MIEVKVFPTGYIDPDKQKIVLRTLEEGRTITVCKPLIWIITFRMMTDYNDLIVLGYISPKITAYGRNASLQVCYTKLFFVRCHCMWSLCLCSTFRWVSQKTEITRSQLIVLSTVFFFSAFWKHGGQVGESPSSPLEISKTAKFEGHCWKRTKYGSSKSCLRANVTYFLCCNKRNRRRLHAGNSKSCRTFVLWWGLKLALPPPPQHTNVCKVSQLRWVKSSLA